MVYLTVAKIPVDKKFSKIWSQLLLESVSSKGCPYKNFIKTVKR